jgi:hypothetical protein
MWIVWCRKEVYAEFWWENKVHRTCWEDLGVDWKEKLKCFLEWNRLNYDGQYREKCEPL